MYVCGCVCGGGGGPRVQFFNKVSLIKIKKNFFFGGWGGWRGLVIFFSKNPN